MKSVTLILLVGVFLGHLASAAIVPVQLKTEYKTNPFTDILSPRLSWELVSKETNQVQSAYRILVSSSSQMLSEGKADLWDSGVVKSNRTNQIPYAGKPLQSGMICYWKVRSIDKNGKQGLWSEVAHWEMGLLSKNDWQAEWIGLDLDHLGKGPVYHLPPAPYARKEIKLKQSVKKARLYVTALGLYEFSINGRRVGDDMLTPGWTDYNKRVYYQIYDVTDLMRSGDNALSAQIGYGWYAGYLGYALLVKNPIVRGFYGKVPAMKAQLEVEYQNGEKEIFATDKKWKLKAGALRESDLLNGETYDARLEFPEWNKTKFDDTRWDNAQVFPDLAERKMQVYPGPPVKITQTLSVKNITKRPEGKYIFDLGQNIAGIVRIKVKGNAGDTIELKYGEKLYPDGRLMTENLRMARSTDTYILKGDKNGETWQPKFTYHGFQYIQVSGLRADPDQNTVVGLVVGSDTPKVGDFQTDNAMVNQLYSNIDWTQRANYVDIPTDCPQRDEKIGWTGDAQVYVKSATFNRNVASFFTKWITDLNDGQFENGAYPLYAPTPNLRKSDTFSPGWMEAGIICPYQIYMAYDDTRLIEQGWGNMTKFMDFLEMRSKGNYVFEEGTFADLSPKGGFGDWLSFGKKTPPDMLATFYFAYCSDLMAEMATAIGNSKDHSRFTNMAQMIRDGIKKHYTNQKGAFITNAAAYGDGKGYVDGELGFTGATQTAYANAIYMNILGKEKNNHAGEELRKLLAANDNKLATGFLGAKPLLPALSASGNSDLAYQLFLSKEFPSWGFEVEQGSTTIWERWDSFTKEDGFKYNAAMNSFSHYAFGAVCEWMFGNAAGIKASKPGYSEFIIRPEICPDGMGADGINELKASYHSIHGKIISNWKKENRNLMMEVEVPVNTLAEIHIPSSASSKIKINNKALKDKSAIEAAYTIIKVGSGIYNIEVVN